MNAHNHPSRASTSSSNSNPAASQNQPLTNYGDVPGSVHRLLSSTKTLQDLLKLWSVGQATERQISDAFIQVGRNFDTTYQAFACYEIHLNDVHSVPRELRSVLEQCLGEDPSPEVLEEYMPQVRQVLYKLLRGLQARQDAWRAAGGQMPMMPYDTR